MSPLKMSLDPYMQLESRDSISRSTIGNAIAHNYLSAMTADEQACL